MYWLFKKYIRRLIAEYAEAYDVEAKASGNPNMRPDLYWLQVYLDGKFEWEDSNGSYVRKNK